MKNAVSSSDFQNKNHFSGETFSAVVINSQIPHDLRFDNCEIKNLLFLEDLSSNIKSINSYNCRIEEIEVNGIIGELSFEDCTIKVFHQELSSNIDSLYFTSTIKNTIEDLNFSSGKTENCIIRGCLVNNILAFNHSFGNFIIEGDNSEISNFYSSETIYKYIKFQKVTLKTVEFDKLENSEIMLYDIRASVLTFKDIFRNTKATLYKITTDKLIFNDFKNSNSILLIEEVSIGNLLKITYSNLGDAELIDCNLTTCQVLTKASKLTQIQSIRVNWPKMITINDPHNKLTEERRNLEKMEFWRQLKVNAINQKNHFNAIEFYAREMDVKYLSFKSFHRIESKNNLSKTIFWFVNPIIDFTDLLYSTIKKKKC